MRKIIFGSLIAFVVVSGALLVERSLRMGRPIPDENAISGKAYPLDAKVIEYATKQVVGAEKFKGKVVLVNFWATWCAACVAEMPSIVKLYEKMKPEGFEVLAINLDDAPDKVLPEFIKEYKLNFSVYLDPDGKLSDHFNVVGIPFSAMLDKNLQVIWAESGERDWMSEEVITEIRRLLK